MFLHNFQYVFKTLFKNRMLIFWTFAFPILLGTFFQMAFSDIEKNEQLEVFKIAVVDTKAFHDNEYYQDIFKQLSDQDNEDQLFSTRYVDEDEAISLLENDEIVGYFILEDEPRVIVDSNGINETVLKFVVEEIAQSESIVTHIADKKVKDAILQDPALAMNTEELTQRIYQETQDLFNQENDTQIKDTSSQHLSYMMIEFYTLIAMTCLYGGTIGLTAVQHNLANMSQKGKRVAISPVPKYQLVLSSVLAGYIIQLIGLLILFLYTVFVLNVDYGPHLIYIVILALVGTLAGLSLGVVVATAFKSNEGTKVGIVISLTMLGCFLSGMMGVSMKYIIDKNIPIINKLNPASMITDGFYSLYYYQTFDRYWFNVISLLIFSLIMIVIATLFLRRQKYDSL